MWRNQCEDSAGKPPQDYKRGGGGPPKREQELPERLCLMQNMETNLADIHLFGTNLILSFSGSVTFGMSSDFPGGSSSLWYTLTFAGWNSGLSLMSITFTVMLIFSTGGSESLPVDLSGQTKRGSSFSTLISKFISLVLSKSFPWKDMQV